MSHSEHPSRPPTPQSPASLLASALSLYRHQHIPECITTLTQLLTTFTNLPEPIQTQSLTIRAKCYITTGSPTNALTDIRKAIKMSPTDQKIMKVYAESLYLSGEFEDALVYFYRAARGSGVSSKTGTTTTAGIGEGVECVSGIHKCESAIREAVDKFNSDKVRVWRDNLVKSSEGNQEDTVDIVRNRRNTMVIMNNELGKFRNEKNAGSGKDGKIERKRERRKKVSDENMAKELLEELYEDRVYLAELLKEFSTSNSSEIKEAIKEGNSFIESRLQFWFARHPSQKIKSTKKRSSSKMKKSTKKKPHYLEESRRMPYLKPKRYGDGDGLMVTKIENNESVVCDEQQPFPPERPLIGVFKRGKIGVNFVIK
ncbi:Tetratricopeptide repeat protein 25 [Nowakowskiella sp. JEL0407]|nr:Tetratricopeptide repeat protein 25 [Nowakowskiella sp. JEL0407]